MNSSEKTVLCLKDVDFERTAEFISSLGLILTRVENKQIIPGSFWGDREAGLKGNVLFARDDTPLHSILHESCHFICMDEGRRAALDTDAGGDYDEENAVCYLQILLSDKIQGFGRNRCMEDMDHWGYSFRLGSAKAWFEEDADDALRWLLTRDLLPD